MTLSVRSLQRTTVMTTMTAERKITRARTARKRVRQPSRRFAIGTHSALNTYTTKAWDANEERRKQTNEQRIPLLLPRRRSLLFFSVVLFGPFRIFVSRSFTCTPHHTPGACQYSTCLESFGAVHILYNEVYGHDDHQQSYAQQDSFSFRAVIRWIWMFGLGSSRARHVTRRGPRQSR